MDSSWNTIIVGAGIAGACAAVHCCRHGRVLVIEAKTPGAGTSGAAAGLVNPFMGRRARPVWRLEEALEALKETLVLGDAQHLYFERGVLRLPRKPSQAEQYRQRTTGHPNRTEWLPAEALTERYPDLYAPHGALFVHTGGFVRMRATITRMLETSRKYDLHLLPAAPVTGWGEDDDGAYVTVQQYTRLYANRVILAIGAGYQQFPGLQSLDVHGVKGQTVTISKPPHLNDLPCLSGYGYVAPDEDTLILGSTYEHDYTDAAPSPEQSQAIIEKVSNMLPTIKETSVLEERAGIRVMTPQTNKAIVGPLPGHEKIWFFGGLGSKGLLTAPMLARRLPQWLSNPAAIPPFLRPDSTRTT